MPARQDHLLRTFAAVPPGARVLDVGCGDGERAEALALLGFSVEACDTDAHAVASVERRAAADLRLAARKLERLDAVGGDDGRFDWVVVGPALARTGSREAVVAALAEARRVLAPGGWLYALVPAVPEGIDLHDDRAAFASDSAPAFTFTPETLTDVARAAGLAVAERAAADGQGSVHGIFRRVERDTVG